MWRLASVGVFLIGCGSPVPAQPTSLPSSTEPSTSPKPPPAPPPEPTEAARSEPPPVAASSAPPTAPDLPAGTRDAVRRQQTICQRKVGPVGQLDFDLVVAPNGDVKSLVVVGTLGAAAKVVAECIRKAGAEKRLTLPPTGRTSDTTIPFRYIE